MELRFDLSSCSTDWNEDRMWTLTEERTQDVDEERRRKRSDGSDQGTVGQAVGRCQR